jgi:hypothetical protein
MLLGAAEPIAASDVRNHRPTAITAFCIVAGVDAAPPTLALPETIASPAR